MSKDVFGYYTHSLNLALNVLSYIALKAAKASKKRTVQFNWSFEGKDVSMVVTFKEKKDGKPD